MVLEAGWRSGSLNTANHAQKMGRPVGAVPGPVTSAASAGCHRLIREGGAELVTTADEMAALAGAPEPEEQRYTRENTRVIDALSAQAPRTAVEIATRAGLSVAEVQSELARLELDGAVREGERGWMRKGARRGP